VIEKASEEDLKKWNKVLSDKGLSLREGAGHGKLLYVGGNAELRIIEKYANKEE
jgi:hypothetical protein